MLWCTLCVPIQALIYPALHLIYQTPTPLLHLSFTSLYVMVYPVCSYPGTDLPCPLPHISDPYSSTRPLLYFLVIWCILCVPIQALIYPALHLIYKTPTPLLHHFFTSLSVMVYPVCSYPGTDLPCPTPHISDPFFSLPPLLHFLICSGVPCVFLSRR